MANTTHQGTHEFQGAVTVAGLTNTGTVTQTGNVSVTGTITASSTITGGLTVTAGAVAIPLSDYADDTAAAAGGVAVGALYHTSGTVKVRLV